MTLDATNRAITYVSRSFFRSDILRKTKVSELEDGKAIIVIVVKGPCS